jgi:acetyltransferase EpsM
MIQNNFKLLICGTRTLAAEVADLASEIPGVEVCGFVENMDRTGCEQPFEGLPVYWIDDVKKLADSHVAVCALATTHRSRFTAQIDAIGMRFATLIHPTARISPRSTIGEGSIISVGVIVAAHTHVGQHVFVNRGALIGHHTKIGDHSSIMPGANVAGNCTMGEATYVGMGAVVIDNLKIGAHSIIGAGAVVVKDVPDNVQVVGVPAKIVKENIAGK